MKLKKDAQVLSQAGEAVGEIKRVVIDPNTKEVTHVVVRKGLLFATDKVVPLSLLTGTDGQLQLRENAVDLEQLPDYEETYYIPLDEAEHSRMRTGEVSAVYWYPPPGLAGDPSPAGSYLMPPPYVTQTERNIPEGTVPLREGARVLSTEGQHVGNVEQVLTDARTDRVTYFVVSAGLLFKTRKLIPAAWISSLTDDEVQLAVGSQLLDQLREYRPPQT